MAARGCRGTAPATRQVESAAREVSRTTDYVRGMVTGPPRRPNASRAPRRQRTRVSPVRCTGAMLFSQLEHASTVLTSNENL